MPQKPTSKSAPSIPQENSTTLSSLQISLNQDDELNIDVTEEELDLMSTELSEVFHVLASQHIAKTINVHFTSKKHHTDPILNSHNSQFSLDSLTKTIKPPAKSAFTHGKASFYEDVAIFQKQQKQDIGEDFESTMLSQRSIRGRSRDIESMANKVDLIAQHIGHKYENQKQVEAQIRRKFAQKNNQNAGRNWYHLPKTQMTESIRNDLVISRNRTQILDSGVFLREERGQKLPEYFQIGTLIDSDPNSLANLSKKEKKRTLTEQFLLDTNGSEQIKKKIRAVTQKHQARAGTGTQYSGVPRNKTRHGNIKRK